MNKLTKDVVIKAIALGAITTGVVLIKELFSDDEEKDFVSVDINKMINKRDSISNN